MVATNYTARFRHWLGNRTLQRITLTLLFSTAVAFGLAGIDYGGGIVVNLVFSHAIGLSILLLVFPLLSRRGQPGWRLLLILALALGSAIGTTIGLLLTGNFGGADVVSTVFLRNLMLGLAFGGILTWFFLAREWIERARADLKERKLREIQAEKHQLETRLRMLQAQVEPHFLFNTLAHLMSLIDHDVDKGRVMLGYLIDYLRSSLLHARRTRVTVADEMAVVDAYLGILSLRMGERMRVTRDVEKGVELEQVPPMILQPLVENAIKHGLEPAPGPGDLRVSVRRLASQLVLEVSDSGAGFNGQNSGGGHGLTNLRERLAVFYGDRARLMLRKTLRAVSAPESPSTR